MTTPKASQVPDVAQELASWQREGHASQLHPGDLGWYSLRGLEATAQSLRLWHKDRRIVAMGLLDGPDLLRIGMNPYFIDDNELATQMAADLNSVARRIFTTETVSVEARSARRLGAVLLQTGWNAGELWTPLHRGLAEPVGQSALSIKVVDTKLAPAWMNVHLSAFRHGSFTEEDLNSAVQRWNTMSSSALYAQGQCLLGYDSHGVAVAAAGVWSAGPDAPGLLEPIGVHGDYRGLGYGKAITLAAAAALAQMGSSSAQVCTPSENISAVAAYAAAGFTAQPPVADFTRARTES